MTTEREYLVGLGLASPGRGKFSNDAKAALTKAREDGFVFELPAYKREQQERRTVTKSPVIVSEPTVSPVSDLLADMDPADALYGVAKAELTPRVFAPAPIQVKTRPNVKSLWGETAEGARVNFAFCFTCAQHVSYCACSGGVTPPHVVSRMLDEVSYSE